MKQNCKSCYFSSDDPRSKKYKRILVYPKLRCKQIIIYFIIPTVLLILAGLSALMKMSIMAFTLVGTLSAYVSFKFKRIAITTIQIYQCIAPTKIRMRCRFEPSCSQYMILAIEKYGVFCGSLKGLKRLSKCNSRGDGRNGGIEYP